MYRELFSTDVFPTCTDENRKEYTDLHQHVASIKTGNYPCPPPPLAFTDRENMRSVYLSGGSVLYSKRNHVPVLQVLSPALHFVFISPVCQSFQLE